MDSQEDCSETLKKDTQLSELIQAGPSRKLWKSLITKQSDHIYWLLLVFNWLDSLVGDPHELLLAVSHLTHSQVRGSVLWVGLGKSKYRNT